MGMPHNSNGLGTRGGVSLPEIGNRNHRNWEDHVGDGYVADPRSMSTQIGGPPLREALGLDIYTGVYWPHRRNAPESTYEGEDVRNRRQFLRQIGNQPRLSVRDEFKMMLKAPGRAAYERGM